MSSTWRNELPPEARSLLSTVERWGNAHGTDDMGWLSVYSAKPIDWINLVVRMKQLLDEANENPE